MSGPRTNRQFLALTVAVLLLAFGLRIYRLPDQSLWYDEAFSLSVASAKWSVFWATLFSERVHPPGHYLMLRGSLALFGDSEFAVRYLSLWWGVLGVALLYRLGKKFFDKPIGLLAAALLAVSPLHVWYSQEARMYSPALTLSLGVVLALRAVVVRRDVSPWLWASYVLIGALALYTHFYTSLILLSVNLAFGEWWLVRAVRESWRAMRGLLIRWIAAQAAVLLFFLPWSRFVAEQYTTNVSYWHGALGLGQIVRDTALAFVAGDRLRTPLAQAAALALAAIALMGLQAAAQSSSDPANRGLSRGERALWLLLWLAVPLIVLFAISHDRPKFAPRYLLPALPALLLLAAAGGARLASLIGQRHPSPARQIKRWLAATGLLLAGGLIVGAAVASLRAQYFDEALARPDFRAVANYIERHAEPGDTIVLVGGHNYPTFDYYFDGDLPVHPMPPGLLPSTRAPLDYRAVTQLEQIAAGRQRLWLALWQDRLADPTEVVLSQLLNNCRRLDVGQMFHDVALLLFSVADCDLTASAGPAQPFRAEFGGQVRLLGYDLTPTAAAPGNTLHLALYWETMGEVATNYTTFAQLLGPDGRVYAQHDRLTGDDAYPTSRWQREAIVRNAHTLAVSPDAPLGTYQLVVGLYVNEGDLPRLPVTYPAGTLGGAVVLTEIQIVKQTD